MGTPASSASTRSTPSTQHPTPPEPRTLNPEPTTAWVLSLRGERTPLDPWRPYASLVEPEVPAGGGDPVPVATLFLTNRECPYRCVMCDLWRNTLAETVPAGAIAAQIRYALECLPAARVIKLYNAGSFFDPGAIPPVEYPEIARLCAPFERVVVESHPAMVLQRTRLLAFRDLLPGRLEVAMGLETAHPEVLARLNKRMDLDMFRRAAELLEASGVDLRVFILLRPPWLSEAEGLEWACRSLDFAFELGATACTVIPTRAGNGAMEALAAAGEWSPPSLPSLERAVEYGLSLRRGRVFADLWDVRSAGPHCPACGEARLARLETMNLTQSVPKPVCCSCSLPASHSDP